MTYIVYNVIIAMFLYRFNTNKIIKSNITMSEFVKPIAIPTRRVQRAENNSSSVSYTANHGTDVTFVQISDELMMRRGDGKWMDDYYKTAYDKMPGYHKPRHFMEIPYWIPMISGMMGERYKKELHIVTDVDSSSKYLEGRPGFLMYSTIEANAQDIKEMVGQLPNKDIIMGGHVNPQEFTKYPNVKYLHGLTELPQHLPGIDTSAPPDNALFKGIDVIPRLTLSMGCLYKCEFCMVPRKLTVLTPEQIKKQVDSLEPLSFNLVYLDDKTFSQASNWRSIDAVREGIRSYNPDFMGFIAQTTANTAAMPGRMKEFQELGIKYLEIGVESINEETLRKLKKPYGPKHLQAVTDEARKTGIQIIPNFIFGIPGDNYDQIVQWVEKNRDIIPVVNVNFLSLLYGAKQERTQDNMPTSQTVQDQDQNAYNKSWLSSEEETKMLQAIRAVYYLTTDKDFYPESKSEQLMRETPEHIVYQAIHKNIK